MKNALYTAIRDRRSVYEIGKEPVIPDEEILALIRHSVRHAPSANNSQGARLLVLLGKEHDKLWDIVMETLRAIVPPEKFARTETKINSFKAGYGTVLFFEDQDTVGRLQQKLPTYRETFPKWALQSNGMLQYSIWISLEKAGFGASLQHYNPLIDEKVKSTWDIPASWSLLAEMVFGKPYAIPEPKDSLSLEERVRVFK